MTANRADKPLIVQSDRSVLLDVHSPEAVEARSSLVRFAELIKSPEHVHTYRISPLSIWNARAVGVQASEMLETLQRFSRFPPPEMIKADIEDLAGRYGAIVLEKDAEGLRLVVDSPSCRELIARDEKMGRYLTQRLGPLCFRIDPAHRGILKQGLVELGYPADDRAGFLNGDDLPLSLTTHDEGNAFQVRDYQRDSVDAFHQSGSVFGGSGVICLPCGAGKTIVGMAVMERLQQCTLILTTNGTSVKQWHRELLEKTSLVEGQIAEYTGERKEIGPVTITTYQMLTWRKSKEAEYRNFELFHARSWGLIIYDEVHLLPAPVFRITAELQARRRLGLTATLIREDGREADVFSLIGPKRYDVPWRNLEAQGWIANATCIEVRVGMSEERRMQYALAPKRRQARIAAENPEKFAIVHELLEEYRESRVLIIGEYIQQLRELQKELGLPLIEGKTPQRAREDLYDRFRRGEARHLMLSRVGNFALDLPDADVLLQISGLFGSRQEEAQRLGRILRPKRNGQQAHFFTLVSQHTREEDFGRKRQLFLAEQGYSYELRFGTSCV